MSDRSHPSPEPRVKLLAAVLYAQEEALEDALARLESAFSPLDHRGRGHPFEVTDYYREEMGAGLRRVLVSFRALISPPGLVEAKLAADAVEDALRAGARRRVNVDVGTLDLFKLVLASRKERGQKIYLGRGVWADLTLTFEKGKYRPLPWSFPDFRSGAYDGDLLAIRGLYRTQLRQARP